MSKLLGFFIHGMIRGLMNVLARRLGANPRTRTDNRNEFFRYTRASERPGFSAGGHLIAKTAVELLALVPALARRVRNRTRGRH
jgi:hypothetical protein